MHFRVLHVHVIQRHATAIAYIVDVRRNGCGDDLRNNAWCEGRHEIGQNHSISIREHGHGLNVHQNLLQCRILNGIVLLQIDQQASIVLNELFTRDGRIDGRTQPGVVVLA